MNPILLLGILASLAVATKHSPSQLVERQLVPVPCADLGQIDCGVGCIDPGWECCPSLDGGCPPTDYCILLSNGEYGCCPVGETCVGEGGAVTFTSVSTTTITDETTIDTPAPTATITASEVTSETTTEVPLPTSTVTASEDVTSSVTYSAETSITPPAFTHSPSTSSNGTFTPTTTPPIATAAAALNRVTGCPLGGLLAGVAAFLL
ncbi:hypothetical protein DL771_005748 [Monosporascus sp. 5C6A]|nr:hypothetical protein DL771_005748 [Monosporascus sp. 5C6A]